MRALSRLTSSAWPFVATFGVQLWLVAVTFPVSEIWSEVPLFYIDAAYHWYNMKLAANLALAGNAVGYDPFFNAGHINGVHYYLSGRFPALLAALLSPGIDEIRLYKIYVFACATLAPLAITAAARALRFTVGEVWIASVLGIFMWWVSYFHWYYTAGMVAYVAGCYLAVLFVALIIQYLEEGGSRWILVALGLLGAFGFFWHPLFPVPVAVAVSAYVAINIRRLNPNRLLAVLFVIPALSLLPNLTWLYPTYRYYEGYVGSTVQTIIDPNLLWQEVLGTLHGNAHGSKVYPLLLLAAVWAFARQAGRRISLALLCAAVAIELLAYLGASLPAVAKIQPNRFAPAGYLLLCIPAARGLSGLFHSWRDRGSWVRRTLIGANLTAALLVGSVLVWELAREVTQGVHGRYGAPPPQVRPLGESSIWVMDWLAHRTSPDARVLFENSFARVHDQAHLAGYYAFQAKREFIGGPYPQMHFASSWDGWAFGKPLAEISAERMAEYLELFNIGWIVVHSDAAKRYFDALPGVRADAEHGKLKAYVVDREHSYFVVGTGRVQERGHNHVLFTDIRGREIVLKYHFVPGLRADPAVEIGSVQMLDDPQPFVRIANPPSRLLLYLP